MAPQESSAEQTTIPAPDVHRPQRRRHHEAARIERIEEESGDWCRGWNRTWSAEEILALLDKVRDDAVYIEEFAMEMSRQRKKPVLILCNARSGSHFHPTIINGLERILGQEERDRFASEAAHSRHWRRKGGKPAAVFETAQRWLQQGRLDSFVYPMKHIKVSSTNHDSKNLIQATPQGLEALIETKCDILFADYSNREFPGSFARHDASAWGHYPGFKEYLLKKSKQYEVFLASRLSLRNTPEGALGKAVASARPVAVCLNPLLPANLDVYVLIDDNHALLGEFGYTREFTDEAFTPMYIQTSQGRMELGNFVRKYLGARA